MEKLIYKVTKPYIHEALAALAIDELLGWGAYLISILLTHDYLLPLVFPAVMTLAGIILDAPLLIKCLIDRKTQIVVEKFGTYIETYPDVSFSNKITRGEESILTTWYFPKEWNMIRYKPVFRTKDGKKIKPRSIISTAKGQMTVFYNIRGIQEKTDEELLFQVKYLKCSKTLLSIKMICYPSSMKKRTKEYIDSNLSDLLKWVIKA